MKEDVIKCMKRNGNDSKNVIKKNKVLKKWLFFVKGLGFNG